MWGEGNFCEQKFPSPHTPHPSKNVISSQNRAGRTLAEKKAGRFCHCGQRCRAPHQMQTGRSAPPGFLRELRAAYRVAPNMAGLTP
ncbi:hypothetical protein DWUX_38 [Desulfovibrio diazotrophicus]|nr:hypothetical protein DWUX_38 [Desulfovibrio diazotrophicus]